MVIGGDFNVRFQLADDLDSRRLNDVLASFNMVQHVRGATHRCGNTLDLVMTFADLQPDDVTVDPAGVISDHALVVCHLPVKTSSPTTATGATERLVRGWRRIDRDEIRRPLEANRYPTTLTSTSCDVVLRDIAN